LKHDEQLPAVGVVLERANNSRRHELVRGPHLAAVLTLFTDLTWPAARWLSAATLLRCRCSPTSLEYQPLMCRSE
jgi:hypothetical protein